MYPSQADPIHDPITDPIHDPIADVAAAEAAWVAAWGATDQDRMLSLMHPDCLVVHGPVGHQSDPDQFLAYNTKVGRTSEARVRDVQFRTHGDVVIVSCLQESWIAFVADATPFVIQAAVTRVWQDGPDGWRLVHMQMARRQPPG